MFGYVMPFKDEMKIKEYNTFKSYYCGLCKAIKREYGYVARMGLNYDLTFLGLLLTSIDETDPHVVSEACIANPIKKRPVLCSNKYLNYCAGLNVMLVYFKLLDDWMDQHSLAALALLPIYYFPYKKARQLYQEKHEKIKNHLEELSLLEKEKCPIIDEAADKFANLMASIFALDEYSYNEYASDKFALDEFANGKCNTNNDTYRTLSWMGYNIGRWIYILDAFHDIEKDIEHKNYNPILLQFRYQSMESPEAFISRVKGRIDETLTFTLDNVAKSFELINVKRNRAILENIIYMGMRDKMRKILEKGENAKDEKSL